MSLNNLMGRKNRMNPTRIAKNLLIAIDKYPRFKITRDYLSEPRMLIAVMYQDSPQSYYINRFYDLPGNNQIKTIDIVEAVVCGVRIRVQHENPDLELFPSLPLEKSGFTKEYLTMLHSDSLETVDQIVMAKIVAHICAKEKLNLINSIGFIKELILLDASEIVKRTDSQIGEAFKRSVGYSLDEELIYSPEMSQGS